LNERGCEVKIPSSKEGLVEKRNVLQIQLTHWYWQKSREGRRKKGGGALSQRLGRNDNYMRGHRFNNSGGRGEGHGDWGERKKYGGVKKTGYLIVRGDGGEGDS